MTKARNRNGVMAVILLAVAGGMAGLTFASVGFLSQVTGSAGAPEAAADAQSIPVSDRTITVQFDANVNKGLPWKFRPALRQVTVKGGQETEVVYLARNISDQTVTGIATYNVTPDKAAPYFSKVACFCAAEHELKPGEQASMPVSFFVDPKIFTDPETMDVNNITLSFTFFRAKSDNAARGEKNKTSAVVKNGGSDGTKG